MRSRSRISSIRAVYLGYSRELECTKWADDGERDENFTEVLERSYTGFRIDQPEVFDRDFHENMQKSLRMLTYDFDIVQPLGLNTPLAQTMVKRVLVGAEGMTYKYLGIRMFSIPFEKEMERCNSILSKRTRELAKSGGTRSTTWY